MGHVADAALRRNVTINVVAATEASPKSRQFGQLRLIRNELLLASDYVGKGTCGHDSSYPEIFIQ